MRKPILLVEDEEHDVLFMRLALEEATVESHLSVVRDGREAIAYLKRDGEFANRQEFPLPGLVLLALRLPRLPGLEVLKWIRGLPFPSRFFCHMSSFHHGTRRLNSAW